VVGRDALDGNCAEVKTSVGEPATGPRLSLSGNSAGAKWWTFFFI